MGAVHTAEEAYWRMWSKPSTLKRKKGIMAPRAVRERQMDVELRRGRA